MRRDQELGRISVNGLVGIHHVEKAVFIVTLLIDLKNNYCFDKQREHTSPIESEDAGMVPFTKKNSASSGLKSILFLQKSDDSCE